MTGPASASDSTSSASDSDDDSTSARFSPSTFSRRQPSKPPYLVDEDDENLSTIEGGGYEAERVQRRERQDAENRVRVEQQRDEADSDRTRKAGVGLGKKRFEMRSLGVQRTQMHHLYNDPALPDSDTTPLRPQILPLPSEPASLDVEIEQQRRRASIRRRCSGISPKRLVYIAVVAVICVALIGVGTVEGVERVEEKKAKEEAGKGEVSIDEMYVAAEASVVLSALLYSSTALS